jgi:hypothetical protein
MRRYRIDDRRRRADDAIGVIRYYVQSSGFCPAAIHAGLEWLTTEARGGPAWIASSTKRQFERGEVGRLLFGQAVAQALCSRRGRVTLTGAGALGLIVQSDRRTSLAGPVLAIYPDRKLLDKLDRIRRVTAILAIPWTEHGIDGWVQRWNAARLGGSGEPFRPQAINPPALREVLRSIVARMNRSIGLAHRTDRRHADIALRRAHAAGIPMDPDRVRAWMVGDGGLAPHDADQIRDLVIKVTGSDDSQKRK